MNEMEIKKKDKNDDDDEDQKLNRRPMAIRERDEELLSTHPAFPSIEMTRRRKNRAAPHITMGRACYYLLSIVCIGVPLFHCFHSGPSKTGSRSCKNDGA